MSTFYDYLKQNINNFDSGVFLEYYSGAFVKDVHYLLSNIHLKPISDIQTTNIPLILVSKSECCYHNELIDIIIEYIIEKKINNVMKLGYTDGSNYNASKNYVFKGYNATLHLLKSKPMEIIKLVLGNEQFISILLNFNAVWIPNNVMLWGELKTKEYKESNYYSYVSCRPMLYIHYSLIRKTNPVVENYWQLLSNIFTDINFLDRKKHDPPKRFRKIVILLKQFIRNHQSHMHEYPYIVDEKCGKVDFKSSDNFSLTIPKSKVINFIMCIIYKVVPVELFGSNKNRTILMRYIPKIINGSIHDRIKTTLLLNKIKINDINWLKPRNNCKMTKIEFIRAKSMFTMFLHWLFKTFICKLTAAFFYVTEASQDTRLLFYRHHTWMKITKRYMSKYFSRHLTNRKDLSNNFESIMFNKDIIGRISLLPKKNSFRLIVKPFKGSKTERIQYMMYRKRQQRPMLQILHTIRLHNGCESVTDIIKDIYNYKHHIMMKYNDEIPTIYAYKFDVKNAYDSLPHDMIDKIVLKRLTEFTSKEYIYVHLFKETDKLGNISKQKRIVVDDLEKIKLGKLSQRYNKTLIDSHETFRFSKQDILIFVRKQYRNTCIHTKSRSYFRNVGVYQGFPFSGLLFNLVYDSLVEELNSKINYDDETIILRLMDDFLVLSTNMSNIRYLKNLTARSIKEYNLNINRLKTVLTTEKLSFVGLDIDISKLVCYKSLNKYNNAPVNVFSFQKLYQVLMRYFELRLSDNNLFNPSCYKSGVLGSRKNIFDLVKAMIYKFCNSFKVTKTRDRFDYQLFSEFLNHILRNLKAKINLLSIGCNVKTFKKLAIKILRHKNILHN